METLTSLILCILLVYPPHILGRNGMIISFKQKLSIVPKKLCFVSCPSALHLRSSSELAFLVNVIAMTPLCSGRQAVIFLIFSFITVVLPLPGHAVITMLLG